MADGCVRLRKYVSYDPIQSHRRRLRISRKLLVVFRLQSSEKKPSWFFHNLPDGCPLVSANCVYVHEELQSDCD